MELVRELQLLFWKVWYSGKFLLIGESIAVLIFKKGSRGDCANQTNISIIQITSKLLASIVPRRLHNAHEDKTRDGQAGFRVGRGCIGQIFNLRC